MKRWMFIVALVITILFLWAGQALSNQVELSENLHCLALNVYHEARSEGEQGQRAVAWATLNRVVSQNFPNDICSVVYQARLDVNGNPRIHQCQFSWYCDGKSDRVTDEIVFDRIYVVVLDVLMSFTYMTDPTGGATQYHAFYAKPNWASQFERTVRVDNHIFYREKD